MDQTEKRKAGGMSTKKRAAGLDALKHLSTPSAEPAAEAATQSVAPVETAVPAKKAKKNRVIFSLHLPPSVHEKLRELSFHERITMTQLALEGIDKLFAERGLPSVAELQEKEE